MADAKKDLRPKSANVDMSDIRTRYKELVRQLSEGGATSIPGIELVADTCHGGEFCHGGTGKSLEFDELIRRRLEQIQK